MLSFSLNSFVGSLYELSVQSCPEDTGHYENREQHEAAESRPGSMQAASQSDPPLCLGPKSGRSGIADGRMPSLSSAFTVIREGLGHIW